MGLLDYIIAGTLAQGSHTGGHFREAAKHNVPMKLNISNFSEFWPDDNEARNNSDIHGAGFKAQDELREGLDDNPEMQKKVATINAILKGLYIADVPVKAFGGNWNTKGDLKEMQNFSGNKATKALLALSMISDLSDRKNGSLSFTTIDGAPSLIWRKRF